MRAFDPVSTLLFDVYHYLEQNGAFGLVPEPILNEPGSILEDGFDTRWIPKAFSADSAKRTLFCMCKRTMCKVLSEPRGMHYELSTLDIARSALRYAMHMHEPRGMHYALRIFCAATTFI